MNLTLRGAVTFLAEPSVHEKLGDRLERVRWAVTIGSRVVESDSLSSIRGCLHARRRG